MSAVAYDSGRRALSTTHPGCFHRTNAPTANSHQAGTVFNRNSRGAARRLVCRCNTIARNPWPLHARVHSVGAGCASLLQLSNGVYQCLLQVQAPSASAACFTHARALTMHACGAEAHGRLTNTGRRFPRQQEQNLFLVISTFSGHFPNVFILRPVCAFLNTSLQGILFFYRGDTRSCALLSGPLV